MFRAVDDTWHITGLDGYKYATRCQGLRTFISQHYSLSLNLHKFIVYMDWAKYNQVRGLHLNS